MDAQTSSGPERARDRAPARPSVCIVTGELVGPFNNGGIGTSMTGLAQTLAEAGFPVTVLYTGGKWSSENERDRWQALYRTIGIDLQWLRARDAFHLAGPLAECSFLAPYMVYEHLRGSRFDVIHFNDCTGEGFYCLTMKRLGIAFQDSLLMVGLHSPSQWIFELNRILPDRLLYSAFNFAERLSTGLPDLLWSPSRYLLEWAHSRGFAFPDRRLVQQYAIPSLPLFGDGGAAPVADGERGRIEPTEIVFFGRLEERKGIRTFCAALDRLEELLAERGLQVTFLGKVGTVGEGDADRFLKRESTRWRFPWQVISDFGQQEAIAYILARKAVAVMASPADNSPCTVYEALTFKMPFLAARTGGIPELILEEDQPAALFEYSAEALAQRLAEILRNGLAPARPAQSQEESRRRWVALFEEWKSHLPPPPSRRPLGAGLTVVIEHDKRGNLRRTLDSLPPEGLGRIIVINRSGLPIPDTHGPTPVVELGQDDPLRLAREIAGSGAATLLLIHSGLALDGGQLRALLDALATPDVDALVPAIADDPGSRPRIIPPLGGSQSFCFYEGAVPGGMMLARADALLKVAGTIVAPEADFFGMADGAVVGGLAIWPYAEVAATAAEPPPRSPERRRSPERVAGYDRATGTERFYIASIAQAAFEPEAAAMERLRRLRELLLRRGFGWTVRLGRTMLPRPLLIAAARRFGGR